MGHPSLGLPPDDPAAGRPAAAARLRAGGEQLAERSLAAAIARDPTLVDRYDETARRTFLRDYLQHAEQLARALETGRAHWLTDYVDWIVPVMRRRHVPMRDVGTIVQGLGDAAAAMLPPVDEASTRAIVEEAVARLDRPRHLPGDRPRGRIASLLWKASGFGGW